MDFKDSIKQLAEKNQQLKDRKFNIELQSQVLV